MIDCVYFNDDIRCYRDGVVERYLTRRKKPGWFVVKNTASSYGYNTIGVDVKNIRRNRMIAWCFIGDFNIDNPHEEVDHIDGNTLNNAVDNLRTCNNVGNHQNRTTAKGYSYHKRKGKYFAHIMINGRMINGTLRLTAEEALKDRADLKAKYHTYFADKEKASKLSE